MTDRLAELSAAGVALWLDDISRQRLVSGNLDELRRDKHVVGVTSNPTIFAKALAGSDAYAAQITDLGRRGVSLDEATRMITSYDVRWACDVLRPAFDATDGVDGRVSLEVDPRLAHQTEKTVAEAAALWWLVDRPNLFIKIPATPEGVPAITATLAQGVSVNVTLIFGLERYDEVIDAFFAGLEQAKANGHDLSRLASVASFFVSRVDTEVDKRLDAIGGPEADKLRATAAIANARLAYQLYEQKFASERWQALAAAGAKPQRPLWASTSTKDPSLRDTLYVEELVAPGVVNTAPEKTIFAYADHGETRGDTITGHYADAQQAMDSLQALGVDFDDVTEVLEREGVEKFEKSWQELLDSVSDTLGQAK